MLTPLPGAWPLKPGCATLPFFGVEPFILNPASGEVLEGVAAGVLAFRRSWPGMMQGVYRDPSRFESAYFQDYKGYYFSGDRARRDAGTPCTLLRAH